MNPGFAPVIVSAMLAKFFIVPLFVLVFLSRLDLYAGAGHDSLGICLDKAKFIVVGKIIKIKNIEYEDIHQWAIADIEVSQTLKGAPANHLEVFFVSEAWANSRVTIQNVERGTLLHKILSNMGFGQKRRGSWGGHCIKVGDEGVLIIHHYSDDSPQLHRAGLNLDHSVPPPKECAAFIQTAIQELEHPHWTEDSNGLKAFATIIKCPYFNKREFSYEILVILENTTPSDLLFPSQGFRVDALDDTGKTSEWKGLPENSSLSFSSSTIKSGERDYITFKIPKNVEPKKYKVFCRFQNDLEAPIDGLKSLPTWKGDFSLKPIEINVTLYKNPENPNGE